MSFKIKFYASGPTISNGARQPDGSNATVHYGFNISSSHLEPRRYYFNLTERITVFKPKEPALYWIRVKSWNITTRDNFYEDPHHKAMSELIPASIPKIYGLHPLFEKYEEKLNEIFLL